MSYLVAVTWSRAPEKWAGTKPTRGDQRRRFLGRRRGEAFIVRFAGKAMEIAISSRHALPRGLLFRVDLLTDLLIGPLADDRCDPTLCQNMVLARRLRIGGGGIRPVRRSFGRPTLE